MNKYDYEIIHFTYEGKPYKTYGKTLEEALEKKVIKLAKLKRGKSASVKTPDTLFSDYAAEWLTTYKHGVSDVTRDDIKRRIEKNINPVIGHYRMKDIRRTDLQNVMNSLQGYSADRCRKIKQTLTQILETALDDDVIYKMPNMKRLELPQHQPDGIRRAITPYEREITLLTAETHYAGAWILTMLNCGLRPQETAALMGRHIDLKNRTILIEQALKRDGNIGSTKGEYGVRTIPIDHIPEQLIQYFKGKKPFDFVFLSKEGRPLNNNNMGTMWGNFKREMQINAGCKVYRSQLIPPYPIADDLVPYCYRHTFATDCITKNVDVIDLKDLMGHTSVKVTEKYYIHMTDERLKKTGKLLAANNE